MTIFKPIITFRTLIAALCLCFAGNAFAGSKYNFNAGWLLALGDNASCSSVKHNDKKWTPCTLPYAWNQAEAYSRNCSELSDTVMWYRKHFRMPKEWNGKKVMIEFEGARFGAQVFLNGKELGWADNGVMAFGFDLTPYILYDKENVLAVRVDNDWRYHEHKAYIDENGKEGHSGFQWNDKNFYCNYGGLNKNVWLHVMGDVHQTLPLYSNLGTTGVYVYANDFNINNRSAKVNVESQVVNSSKASKNVSLRIQVLDRDGKSIADFCGAEATVAAGDTTTIKASRLLHGLHFWSWGYGYLYTVKSLLVADGETIDSQEIQTGFRKAEYKDGMFYLNDRVLQLKGFAQRSTNEWPALGISIPSWMSDYSNRQILECNGNMVRWMHVTPSKQDIRSFDRLGLIQAMPAGDAEKDVTGRRWEQRCEVMRDAIIYNRNNPSILFYEGGNNQINDAHMAELMAIRDQYDPNGGRAIGSRNMLDSEVAEYGGEMLYVNKSAAKPMWQMEYNRDEGIRRYWDEWSYPYHKEGEGPLYRGDRTKSYNHNQDGLAIENIVRWNEYWLARPGQGRRVNSGGAKIIFSDSNTHARGEKNYRTSGDMDAMRLPKDSWFCHQVMWDGWVDTERDHTYIIGHWNYDSNITKPVYVCSTGDEVELFLNGRSLGKGKRSETFLFTWNNVKWEKGTLKAVAYRNGKTIASDTKQTAGEAVALKMHWVDAPEVMRADGADIRICEIEAVDASGMRHPLAHDMIHFDVKGAGDYIGGVSGVVSEEEKKLNAMAKSEGHEGIMSEGGHSHDTNGVGSHDLMLEAGVIRVMVRSNTTPGTITLTATPKDSNLAQQSLSISTADCLSKDGFYVAATASGKKTITTPIEADWAKSLPVYLERGETPSTRSFTPQYNCVAVKTIETAVNQNKAKNMIDDNEASSWSSDQNLQNSWLKVTLERPAAIRKIALRVNGFRTTSYPLQVFAGETLVWEGYTDKTLGDCYLNIATPVSAQQYTIKMVGAAGVKEAFASMTELAAKNKVSTKESKSNTLSIIEMEFDE